MIQGVIKKCVTCLNSIDANIVKEGSYSLNFRLHKLLLQTFISIVVHTFQQQHFGLNK